MASLQNSENASGQQFLYRKPKKRATHGCYCCIEVLSGCVLLILIASAFTVLWYFLEFSGLVSPHAVNTTRVLTSESAIQTHTQQPGLVNASSSARILSGYLPMNFIPPQQLTSAQNIPGQAEGIKASQYFMGSFQLMNETYHPSYNDSTSDTFKREAEKLENMVAGTFGRSVLNESYQGSRVLALSPRPFTVHIRLQFSNGPEMSVGLSNATVGHALVQGYQRTGDKAEMSMDASSLLVRDDGTCSSELVWHRSEADARWPWQATVRENGDPTCAGCLISAGWVFCLASCVTTSNPSVYSVQLGTQAGSGTSSPDGQRLVARIIHHPDYAHSPSTHDIALIQLAESVPFTSSIQPICLPEPLHLVPSGTTCWTAGSEPMGSAPQALEWTVASAASCSHLTKDPATCAQNSLSIKPAHQMAAGGAFVCPGKNGLLYIEGIIPCTIKNQTMHPYATFTRVAPFVPWMQSYLLT